MAFVLLAILGKQGLSRKGVQALSACGCVLHSCVFSLLVRRWKNKHAAVHTHTTHSPKQGTCSHAHVFVRRALHVPTQCKLLIAHIQTLNIKLVLHTPLLLFIKKDIFKPFFFLVHVSFTATNTIHLLI